MVLSIQRCAVKADYVRVIVSLFVLCAVCSYARSVEYLCDLKMQVNRPNKFVLNYILRIRFSGVQGAARCFPVYNVIERN